MMRVAEIFFCIYIYLIHLYKRLIKYLSDFYVQKITGFYNKKYNYQGGSY